ncbi:hypothetical protein BYT27DRAFT_7334528 [Phlegmacium glaucopus]|nr:hypothetical protein BYT27DRAFT_7334528 [Phlegmacium glaucopus]
MFSPNYSRGSATRSLACYEAYKSSYFSAEEKEILCDRPCTALPNAGKKGRRRVAEDEPIIGEEYGGLHECDLVDGMWVPSLRKIMKRNARLADALGISLEGRESAVAMAVTYTDELSGFARVNPKFLSLVERTFVDVQVIRRIDTRIPTPLISTFIPAPGLGKLADFRVLKGTPSTTSWRSTAATSTPSTKPTQGSTTFTRRGWTSVVASGTSSTSTSAATTNSLLAPKPTSTTTSSLEALGGSQGSSLLGAAGPTSRTVSPAQLLSEPVPENWEDDDV